MAEYLKAVPSLRQLQEFAVRGPVAGLGLEVVQDAEDVLQNRKDSEYRAEAVHRFLEAAFLLFDSTTTGQSLMIKESDVWRLVAIEATGNLEKCAKCFYVWPLAQALGNPLPKVIEGIDYTLMLGPRFKQLMSCYAQPATIGPCSGSKGASWREFLVTLANRFKRCLLPVSIRYVINALDDYGTLLKEEGPLPPGADDMDYESQSERTIKSAIDRLVREVFPYRGRGGEEHIPTPLPSSNSCFERSIGSGGAAEELYSQFGTGRSLFTSPELHSIQYTPTSGMKTFYTQPFPVIPIIWDMGRPIMAKTQPILEACKVRVITKGEAVPYFTASRWDRMVRKYLHQHPTFRLICGPDGPEMMNIFRDKLILSGDYSSATDRLSAYYSEYLLQAVNKRLNCTVLDGVVQCLTRHVIRHPTLQEVRRNVDGKLDFTRGQICQLGYEIEQKRGQLMGSFASFTVLSMLNAAINAAFLDPDGKKRYCDLPLLVNGDDVLMSADSFEGWEEHVAQVGLLPSMGKNYIHSSVFCVNSHFYRRTTLGGEMFVSPVHDVPINLIYGQGRVLNAKSSSNDSVFGNRSFNQKDSLTGQSHRLVRDCSREVGVKLITKYIRLNADKLKSTKRSWWLPTQLGGLGLPFSYRNGRDANPIKDRHRALARLLMECPSPRHSSLFCVRNDSALTKAGIALGDLEKQWSDLRGLSLTWVDDPLDEGIRCPFTMHSVAGMGLTVNPKIQDDEYNRCERLVKAFRPDPLGDDDIEGFIAKPRYLVYKDIRRTWRGALLAVIRRNFASI